MFLTIPQTALLMLLRDFHTLRVSHVSQLLRLDDSTVDYKRQMIPLMRGGKIRRYGDFLVLQGGSVKMDYIESIDIALKIGPDSLSQFQKGTAPFSLTFFKTRDERLWRYDICPVKLGMEPVINAALEGIETRYRMIVFVPECPEQVKGIYVDCEHSFAFNDNGKFKFYKAEKRLEK